MNHVQANRLQAMQMREAQEFVAVFNAAVESWLTKRMAKYQAFIRKSFAGPEPGRTA